MLGPFYLEDTDLGFLAWKRGWKVLYQPASVVWHEHRGTIGKRFTPAYIQSVLQKNFLLFTWKNIHRGRGFAGHFFAGAERHRSMPVPIPPDRPHRRRGIARAFRQVARRDGLTAGASSLACRHYRRRRRSVSPPSARLLSRSFRHLRSPARASTRELFLFVFALSSVSPSHARRRIVHVQHHCANFSASSPTSMPSWCSTGQRSAPPTKNCGAGVTIRRD